MAASPPTRPQSLKANGDDLGVLGDDLYDQLKTKQHSHSLTHRKNILEGHDHGFSAFL